MNHPLDNCLREIEWLRAEWAKSKNRIEALEAALREVASGENSFFGMMEIARRAALAPTIDKEKE